MHYSSDEFGSHHATEEFHAAEEAPRLPASPADDMNLSPAAEYERYEEIPLTDTAPAKKENKIPPLSTLTRFLASATVTCAVTAAVVLPVALAPSAPPAHVTEQDIGYNAYTCVMETDEGAALEVWLESEEYTSPVTSLSDTVTSLSFSDLMPQTDYRLWVIDEDGDKSLAHTFTTDPYVTFGTPRDNILPLILHEDLLKDLERTGGDAALHFLAEDGRDYSGHLVWDPQGESLLYTNALHRGNYALSFIQYPPDKDEPIIYESYLTLGDLTPLSYDIATSYDGDALTQIDLTLTAGALAPYELSDISLEGADELGYYRSFYSDDLIIEGTRITVPLPEPPAAGRYIITVWAEYTDGEEIRYCEIWQGELLVTDAT